MSKEISDELINEVKRHYLERNRKLVEEHAKPPSPDRDKNIKSLEWMLAQHEKLFTQWKIRLPD